MNLHSDIRPTLEEHQVVAASSPVASERIRALAVRAIEGAPALTAGEMRELAEAILEHNARSEQDA